LRFFVDYRQKDWLEWLVIVEFVVNNKIHSTTLFMANYGRELRMGADIIKKEKVEKTTEFVERITLNEIVARTNCGITSFSSSSG